MLWFRVVRLLLLCHVFGLIDVHLAVIALDVRPTPTTTSGSSSSSSSSSVRISFDRLSGKRILVVGGSGRVGGSVTTQLIQHGAAVAVGGTQLSHFESAQRRWLELYPQASDAISKIPFVQLHREQVTTISNILMQPPPQQRQSITGDGATSDKDTRLYDLVIHTAGPFQGKVNTLNGVVLASIEAGIPYIDVCDDYCTACATKTKYSALAEAESVPVIVATGCWPGISSLMAKQLVSKVIETNPQLSPSDLAVRFSFFTAGSGGAGVTLLVATFLILAEQALMVVHGRRRLVPPMQTFTNINFGSIVGNQDVAHLNLLETASIHDTLGVGSTCSLFGTAPDVWNTLLSWMARLPSNLLSNESIMRRLSIFSLPIVRLVDFYAGATNAMRCDVYQDTVSLNGNTSGNSNRNETQPESLPWQATAIYAHNNLELCVGECVTAFSCAILSGQDVVPPGVWFPEEAIASGTDAATVLSLASVNAHTTDVQTENLIHPSDRHWHRDQIWGASKVERTMEDQ